MADGLWDEELGEALTQRDLLSLADPLTLLLPRNPNLPTNPHLLPRPRQPLHNPHRLYREMNNGAYAGNKLSGPLFCFKRS